MSRAACVDALGRPLWIPWGGPCGCVGAARVDALGRPVRINLGGHIGVAYEDALRGAIKLG